MRAVIRPGAARGTVASPPSKSMSHRLLICAGLADGKSEIRNVDRSEDILATMDCLRSLGAEVKAQGDTVSVRGCDPRRAKSALLPCRESGATLRFFIPLCLLSGSAMRLTGSERLMERPLDVYRSLCAGAGMRFELGRGELLVQGPLRPGTFCVPGGVSSQFASGLLMSLPLLDCGSTIRLLPPVESRSYIDMTVRSLKESGVDVAVTDGTALSVQGRSSYTPRSCCVEGDWSNAAFFGALGVLGGSVRITGLRQDSLQGDRVYPAYFAGLAGENAALDVSDCPDLAPVLMALAGALHGCTLTGTRRLRHKESDRGRAMAEELAKFGVKAEVGENEIRVVKADLRAPEEELCGHNDHRVVMALSVLCTLTGGTIEGAGAVRKSFPGFWDSLRSLGIGVDLYED